MFDIAGVYLPDLVGHYIDLGKIHSWITYDPLHPLLFNSGLFLGLFTVFYIIYVLVKSQRHDLFRKLYVIVFSLFFYYKAGGNYYILLVVCALVTHWFSVFMYKTDKQSTRKLILAVVVIVNLGMLAYYKYANFLIDNINAIFHGDLSLKNIVLPIGISFFVFEAISYAVDLYRRQMEPAKSTLDFCFYITFFPKLVAGPIIRAKDFLPQMYKKLQLTKEEAGGALFLIVIGLIKKAVISDYISTNFVDRIFDSPLIYSSFENLMAVYGYTLQIYCDFSGYSDMAIGLSLLMGFHIPANFNMPYKSQSITEFWRRWHISLSSWLRDYLYISLGGNRRGKFRTYLNLFLTMLIGGLWHGASWKFVIWGGLHGFVLALERFLKQFIPLSSDNRLVRCIRIFITFHIVAFCWIFFRAGSFDIARDVIASIGNLTFNFNINQQSMSDLWNFKINFLDLLPKEWAAVIDAYRNVFLIMMIGYIMHFLPERFIDWLKNGFTAMPLVLKAVFTGLAIWLVYATASSGPQPFIYFQF